MLRIAVCAALIVSCGSTASAQVTIESVEPLTGGARAGLRPGDILTRWERLQNGHKVATGRFEHPFDVRQFEIEQLPRGGSRVFVVRGERAEFVLVDRGLWGVESGLILRGTNRVRYQLGLRAARRNDIVGVFEQWRPLAVDLESGQPSTAAWLYCRLATTIVAPVATGFWGDDTNHPEGARPIDADALFEKASQLARRTGDRTLEALVHEAAATAWRVDVLEPARISGGRTRKAAAEALRLRLEALPQSLSVAASQRLLAAVWTWHDDRRESPDPHRARTLYEGAVNLQSRLAPGSFDEALTRLKLALLLFKHFSREQARARAEAHASAPILSRLAGRTHTLRVARTIESILAGENGDYAVAADLWRQSRSRSVHTSVDSDLRSIRRFAPGAPDEDFLLPEARKHLAGSQLAAAAATLKLRARLLVASPPFFLKRPRASKSGEGDALLMLDLGDYARELGHDRSAAAFYRQALRLVGAPAPADVRDLACVAAARLVSLSDYTLAERDRLDAECEHWRSPAPRINDPYGEYRLLLAQADLAAASADRATQVAVQAVDLRRIDAPKPWLASALHVLGMAQCTGGQRVRGMATLRQSVRFYAPAGSDHPGLRHLSNALFSAAGRQRVAALGALGECAREAGRLQEAADALHEAVLLSERHSSEELVTHLARAFETARVADLYRDLAGVLVELGRPTEAFRIAEQGRARALRRVLSERNLNLEAWPSWVLKEIEVQRGQRSELLTRYVAAQQALQDDQPRTPAETLTRVVQLHAIALELDAAESRLRTTFSRPEVRKQAAGIGADAANLRAVVNALGPRGVMLAYSVGKSATELFVVGGSDTKRLRGAVTIARGQGQLENLVRMFRGSLEPGAGAAAAARVQLGRELYQLLINPAESLIAAADRIVIVPDGALIELPFSALIRDVPGAGPQFLIEWKPIHTAPSAATYVLIRQSPRPLERGPTVAVGDPLPPATLARRIAPSAGLRGDPAEDPNSGVVADEEAPQRGGTRRKPLPGSRQEVEQIANLVKGDVTVLIGPDATESRVRSVAPSAGILHFATHAVINKSFLLDSGLALSHTDATGGDDNGFLQAWEIIDLRLKADLVTLSACESASGRNLPGEGAMSLARAFHSAGARSVVSTLWSIDDRATVSFMTAFYSGIRNGLSKDESLRQAQIAHIRGAAGHDGWSAPSSWAAFQLSGDWQ